MPASPRNNCSLNAIVLYPSCRRTLSPVLLTHLSSPLLEYPRLVSLAFPHSLACRLLCGDLSSLRCGILKGCLPPVPSSSLFVFYLLLFTVSSCMALPLACQGENSHSNMKLRCSEGFSPQLTSFRDILIYTFKFRLKKKKNN